jgi:hypothetical protein
MSLFVQKLAERPVQSLTMLNDNSISRHEQNYGLHNPVI